MGIANELQYVKGPAAAANLLASAGPWTKSIDSIPGRRHALIAFATGLFKLDDFDAGQKMLQQETDAAWRSDVLAMMASSTSVFTQAPTTSVPGSIGAAYEAQKAPSQQSDFYGKSLNYEKVFKDQKQSQTSKD
jgi:hypothetical protein